MAEILLIRHAEPELTGVLLGQSDPPLSAAGRTQAREELTEIHAGIVWASPLRRAKETAQFISSNSICELPELCEIDMGAWTGLTWTQVEQFWAELAGHKMSNWFQVAAPGGESWSSFLSRVQRAWDAIRRGPANAAVVAHQGVNAALCYLIEGRDPTDFQQGYCEVIPFEYEPLD
jgi:broad specificity phosphatase PhoE